MSKTKYREVLFEQKARERLLKGIDRLSKVVSITLGPRGQNVILDSDYGVPRVVNDGVTIAETQEYLDDFEDLGAQLIKQVSKETENAAGDGTTTATILAHAIVSEGMKNVTAGANPIQIKRGLDKACETVVTELGKMSKELKTKDEMARVATISANDPGIGQIIADAMDQAGRDGVITVEESETMETTFKTVEGMQFDRGYLSPYFITNAEKMEVELKDPYILVTDQELKQVHDLVPILEKVSQEGKPLVIIAENVDGAALTTLVINKLRETVSSVAVKAPGFGDRRKDMLQDVAVLTGAQVISKDAGMKIESTALDLLGSAERVIVSKDDTTIIGGNGNPKEIALRVQQLVKQKETTDSDYDQEKLQERIAKLSGGVVIIKAGATTETELQEKKHRMEDALEATKAAIEEGILPGGGVALLNAAKALDRLSLPDEDQAVGVKILKKAVEAPLRKLAENAGFEGSIVVEKVKTLGKGQGYDVLNEKYGDMVAAGILDPTKVTKSALQNAVSVAGMILTTGAAVVIKESMNGHNMPTMDYD